MASAGPPPSSSTSGTPPLPPQPHPGVVPTAPGQHYAIPPPTAGAAPGYYLPPYQQQVYAPTVPYTLSPPIPAPGPPPPSTLVFKSQTLSGSARNKGIICRWYYEGGDVSGKGGSSGSTKGEGGDFPSQSSGSPPSGCPFKQECPFAHIAKGTMLPLSTPCRYKPCRLDGCTYFHGTADQYRELVEQQVTTYDPTTVMSVEAPQPPSEVQQIASFQQNMTSSAPPPPPVMGHPPPMGPLPPRQTPFVAAPQAPMGYPQLSHQQPFAPAPMASMPVVAGTVYAPPQTQHQHQIPHVLFPTPTAQPPPTVVYSATPPGGPVLPPSVPPPSGEGSSGMGTHTVPPAGATTTSPHLAPVFNQQ